MHAQDFIIDKSTNGHAVEDILEFFPDSDAVSSLALVIETVDTVDLATLVISSEKEEILLEFDFVG